MLMSLRRSVVSSERRTAATSRPPISTLPAVGSTSRLTRRINVDLPEPDRPISTKISPSRTSNDTSCRPTTCPVRLNTSSFVAPAAIMSSACYGLLPNTLHRPSTTTLGASIETISSCSGDTRVTQRAYMVARKTPGLPTNCDSRLRKCDTRGWRPAAPTSGKARALRVSVPTTRENSRASRATSRPPFRRTGERRCRKKPARGRADE